MSLMILKMLFILKWFCFPYNETLKNGELHVFCEIYP